MSSVMDFDLVPETPGDDVVCEVIRQVEGAKGIDWNAVPPPSRYIAGLPRKNVLMLVSTHSGSFDRAWQCPVCRRLIQQFQVQREEIE